MVKIELKLNNKFLDKHTMGEFEMKFWDWLQQYELSQGDLADSKVKIKIVVESDYL